MSESNRDQDFGSVWRGQPEEMLAVNLNQIMDRRMSELHSRTRSEILTSVGAAVLLIAVVAWRFAPESGRLVAVGIAAGLGWIAITLYSFRGRIWANETPRPDAVAASGLAYYRAELERRRDHLRSIWLWNGPLVLACGVLVAVLAGRSFLGFERFGSAIPLMALLAGWVAFGFWRRRLQAREIQREIEELGSERT
jgi:hypothetical protein